MGRLFGTTSSTNKTGGRLFGTTQKVDTSSSAGLYNMAVQNGLQKDADRILATQQGEDTKQIFSGGFISDIFDVLNAAQYGVVGLLKGKSFGEGVKTRQSFSDKDALGNNGLPGVIAGIALDIAVDPLTYIAPATILEKIPGLSRLTKFAKETVFGKMVEKTIEAGAEGEKTMQVLEGGSRVGRYFAEKFAFLFGADPIYKTMWDRGTKNIVTGTQNVVDLNKGIGEINDTLMKTAQIFTKDETGRIIRKSEEQLAKELSPENFAIIKKGIDTIKELGNEQVKLGMLSKETFEENINKYIQNNYEEFLKPKDKGGLFNFMKLGIKRTKGRVEGLTPEAMAKLGQIDNPAFLFYKTMVDMKKDVETGKLFQEVSKAFGSAIKQEGFTKLPDTARLGKLSGKWLPEHIFKSIQDISEPGNVLGKEIMGNFKFMKVVLSPATNARNMISNTLLNWWKLGMGPWRADLYGEATKNVWKGGKYLDEAKTVGFGMDTFKMNELNTLLETPESFNVGKKIGNNWNKIKDRLGSIYQGEENVAKMAAFIFQRKKGIGIEEAWKAAESATFNYAQVTPFVRKLRTALWGFPFITFTLKSTPLVAETMLKHPGRISVLGKIKQAIETQSDITETAREKASEPAYIKDGFYVKLPMKDKNGNSAYFDLTYIIPFGDLIAGNFFERKTSRETGQPEGVPQSVMSKAPLFNVIKELSKNEDFYGDKIWQDSDDTYKQLGDIMTYLTKTYMPPPIADQIPGGYKTDGTRRQKGIVGAMQPGNTEQRTMREEMLKYVGMKIQPIDADIQESYQEWNKRKALETLLTEKGLLKEFKRTYVPK